MRHSYVEGNRELESEPISIDRLTLFAFVTS